MASNAVCCPERAMGLYEVFLHRPVERADHHVGQIGEGPAGLLRGNSFRQNARADQEHLLLAEHADTVEKILVRCRLPDRPFPFARNFVSSGSEPKKPGSSSGSITCG